ncbi:MAG TPA: flagellar hook-basal body complex protein FliE [Pseudogracilibacillus sp.]|nr:flagellar hook-basal body complex protein FliE [Pseudogracilibacillus sp.]
MFDKVNLMNHSPINKIEQKQQVEQNNPNQFKNILKNALEKVSKVENEANVQQQLLINGKTEDLHQVMLAAQKATITIETAVQIQQKVIDAYNEVMRMQI